MFNGEGYPRRQDEIANHLRRPPVFNQVEGKRDMETVRTQVMERQQNNSGTAQ